MSLPPRTQLKKTKIGKCNPYITHNHQCLSLVSHSPKVSHHAMPMVFGRNLCGKDNAEPLPNKTLEKPKIRKKVQL